jgi:hypothetical protein
MDLTKQFPDISREVREKFRLRKKLYPNFNYNSLPPYETDKYLDSVHNHGARKWIFKLLFLATIGSLILYLLILSVPKMF